MPFIAPEQILEAKQMDLMTYLQNYEPSELVRFSGDTYTTRTHDSLKISNGKWMWWSQGIGGRSALDYLIKVKGLSFLNAVEAIRRHIVTRTPVYYKPKEKKEVPLLLPAKSKSTDVVFNYLFERGIDFELINYCIDNGFIIESLPYHNAVFIGYDSKRNPRYAAFRATDGTRIMGDCTGSKKDYSFRLVSENTDDVHLFECAIDLLSYATLCKFEGNDWRKLSLVSLAGVYSPKKKIEESKIPVALEKYINTYQNTKRIILHFDNDKVGRDISQALKIILPAKYEVIDEPPPMGKDFNDFLRLKLNITPKKNKLERSYER